MENSSAALSIVRRQEKVAPPEHTDLSLGHYLRLILHRKWWAIGVFAGVSLATIIVCQRLPNVYSSETLILVDPQKVPETYVKATVTGDVRNRLGTLSQQILSATRLQKIIDTFGLYPQERKTLPREDVILLMRSHIGVNVLSDFGGSQDLQAFRITYSGQDPRLVARVTNELASLFIEENLKAREQQSQGTTDFLQNQLQETRAALEQQEAKLKNFKLHHIGEMPEQQAADLQILGQVQSQLQAENDALSRAEQQKNFIQSTMVQSEPAVDLDDADQGTSSGHDGQGTQSAVSSLEAKLSQLRARYSENYPDVQRVKKELEEERRKDAQSAAADAQFSPAKSRAEKKHPRAVNHFNPILQSQLEAVDAEIAKHKAEQSRLSRLAASYQGKLQAIPVREQEINELVRDYEISKTHYSQLLQNQLSAETATQLEIRQKGEKFSVLDPAQPAEAPSRPNRKLIDAAGSLVGLVLGLLVAVSSEFFGVSVSAPEQLTELGGGLPVLEVIPIIQTASARKVQKKRMIIISSGAATVLAACLLYYIRAIR